MHPHVIRNHQNGTIIFEGKFSSLAACAEAAVADRVNLDYADLSRGTFINSTLDDASLRYASLDGANLMGANLSEANLDNASFMNAGLQNACLCLSSAQNCDFRGALFGATDIAGTDIAGGRFSTLSAFQLNFNDTKAMQGCVYEDFDIAKKDHHDACLPCIFSRPPIVISGLPFPIIMMDRDIKIGCLILSFQDIRKALNDNYNNGCKAAQGPILPFLRIHERWLIPALESRGG